MISGQQFSSVFRLPETPSESEIQIVAQWTFNHEHKPPSQRVKSAIRKLSDLPMVNTLLDQYIYQIRSDSVDIDIHDVKKLALIKEYFMFPMLFLQLNESQYNKLERAINSIIRSKINSTEGLTGEHEEFVLSLGLDVGEIARFNHTQNVNNCIKLFANTWTKSFKNEVDGDETAIRSLISLRISEIFEIVGDYPNSIPALNDLKNFIRPQERSKLVTSFTTNCQKKLLHAGTDTDDIIAFYTSTIKSFLFIDPRGVLLDNCSRSIRRYLKERPDTIQNIVHALVDTTKQNKLSHLSDELSKEQERQITKLSLDWTPDPIDALPDFKKKDIIESLMSIFDNKEAFVEELVEVFAQKLLNLEEYGLMDIMTKLEQLRLRFEENELNNIDVMVNDIKSSARLNADIHSLNPGISERINFFILSHLYWPEVQEVSFKLPQDIQHQIDAYYNQFETLKQGRCIRWVNSGQVSLDIEVNDKLTHFEVTPDKAMIINLFNERSELSLQEITNELEMEEAMARISLEFWVKQRILKKVSGEEIFKSADAT